MDRRSDDAGPGFVMPQTLTVIIHGHEWPDPTWSQEVRAALEASCATPDLSLRVVEVRESGQHARGAAAVISDAVEAASSEVLLVIEAGAAFDRRLLSDLVEEILARDVLAVAAPGYQVRGGETAPPPRMWNDAWVPSAAPDDLPFTTLLQQAVEISVAQWSAQLHASRPRLWAMRRPTLIQLGGLDRALWSIGVVEDLADRCMARGVGLLVRPSPPPAASPHDAWPLQPQVRMFLALRNALLSATRSREPRRAGRTLGLVSALAFADAWRQADVQPEALRFGGPWQVTPARPAGAILPILAMDACLDAIIARATDPAFARVEPAGPPVAAAALPAASPMPPTVAPPASPPPDTSATAPTADQGPTPLPKVSVIVVNWNGREHLTDCFTSLLQSDYPDDRIEYLCVDNGSTDDSRTLLQTSFPRVKVVALGSNRGFTGGNIAGVAAATGDVLVFFNNDMRVEPAAIRALVTGIGADVPCTAAQVLSWNGRHIDFVRGSANFEAHGFQDHYAEAWSPDRAVSGETFFPNGGAFAITRDAYHAAGGFDDLFFAYYDDVDLGYGVRMNGGRIRVVPEARVYHRHGATSRRYPQGQKRFLMERNAIWTVLKRYEEPSLERALGGVLLLAARRIAQETVLYRRLPWVRVLAPFSSRCRRRAESVTAARTGTTYEFRPSPGSPRPTLSGDLQTAVVERMPVESLAAVGEALRGLPEMTARRQAAQARRVVSDRQVFRELGRPLAYGSPLTSYQAAHDALVDVLRLAELFRSRPRLLIVTHEPLRPRMSGPGVRVLELGRVLSANAAVTIATPAPPEIVDDRCTLAAYDPDRPQGLRRLAEGADAMLVQGFTLTQFPFLTGMHVPIAVDLYCPFTIEFLEMKTAAARAHGAAVPDIDAQMEAISVLEVQKAQLRHGDFFICASERQRDFWIGALHGANRVNVQTYATDTSLRRLIDVVPFGVPQEDFVDAVAAARARLGERVLKGVRPGISKADKLLFWGGSLLDWQDPLTLIRAVARLARANRGVRLFFAGTRHPNPHVKPMLVVERSVALARDLGVLDSAVFFNDWIPYEDRSAYLREADIGVSTHRLHLETHLSFRTRMLDYIWAALPIVCTEGDHFADLVRARGLGLVVPPEDDEALAAAIARLLDDLPLHDQCRVALREVREEMRWARVADPLRRFVAAPHFAADHEPAMRAIRAKLRTSYRTSKWLKRTALKLGMSEGRVEQLKALPPVRAAMHMRNRLALARAGKMRG